MSKVDIYGKAKVDFYLVAQDSLSGVCELSLVDDFQEIDFVMQKGNYKLDDNEIFFIKVGNEEIGDYLHCIRNTSSCNSITNKALSKLESIFVYSGNDGHFKLYIQRVMPSYRVEKILLSFNPDIKLAHIEKKITIPIHNQISIYWNQEKQKIYFKKFSDLESLFPNFSHYYRDANEEDFNALKDTEKYPFLKINIDFNQLQKTKLKTLAMIVDEIENVKNNLDDYKQYASKYKSNFIKNHKFEINNIKDIDNLSDVVFRKIWTTEAGNKEIRKANSYKPYQI